MRGMVLPWSKEQNEEGDNDKTDSQQAEDQVQLYGSGGETGWPYAKGHRQRLNSGSEIPSGQESNHKVFEANVDITQELSGYHRGFHAYLSIIYDGGIEQDKPKLDRCFLLPLFERIPQTENARRLYRIHIPTETSWGLVLLRQDDGSYTRLGVYKSPDRWLRLSMGRVTRVTLPTA